MGSPVCTDGGVDVHAQSVVSVVRTLLAGSVGRAHSAGSVVCGQMARVAVHAKTVGSAV